MTNTRNPGAAEVSSGELPPEERQVKRSGSADLQSRRRRGRLRPEDAAVLHRQLIDAARTVFTTDGYGGMSMVALARRAQISRTTLYARFPTKAAAFDAIVEAQMADAYGALDAPTEQGATLAARLRLLAETALTAAMRPEELAFNRWMEWEACRFPELAEMLQSKSRIMIERIARYIRESGAEEEVPLHNAEEAAEVFQFMLRGLYHEIGIGRLSPSPAELRRLVDRIISTFLSARPFGDRRNEDP